MNIERFRARIVAKSNGCHEWNGATDPQGYGRVNVDGKNSHAHRVAWKLANGPIPEGISVCHRCDNPPCCNVGHLFIGTNADNVADRVAKGRTFNGRAALTHCPHGHPYDEVNTYMDSGGRKCRACHRARVLAQYHKDRAAGRPRRSRRRVS